MALLVVAVPFAVAGLLAVAGHRVAARWVHPLVAGVMLALFGAVLTLIPAVRAGGPIVQSLPWVPDLGLSLEWYVDGLALLFALLITGIGAAVFAYAGFYMDGHDRSVRFAVLLSGFAGSMLGVVLAGNLLALFVCWELTSVFSFLLIGFERDDPRARSAAVQALVITGGGGLALLVGLVLISVAAGTSSFADLVAIPLQDHPWYAGITVLVLVGCFTKSAQMPAHFWLPAGMTAPTPASAYLHSATMVKAGVYLLARFWPTLGDTTLWTVALVGVGTVTMLSGAAIALRQRDLKALLAYATVSWLGALVLLLGLPDGSGYQAAMVGIVAHALYKSPLFMVAGVIDHATGTRMIDRLGGLARPLPAAAAVTVVSGLSMAGVIPLLGFVAKEGLLEAVAGHGGLLVTAAVSLAALLTVVAALILAWDVFFAAPPAPAGGGVARTAASQVRAAAPQVHVPPALMLLGPGLITALSLVVGLLTDRLVGPLVALASPLEVSVHLFHGFTPIFALSLGLIAAGVAVFSQRGRWRRWPVPHLVSGQGLYDTCRRVLNRTGDVLLRLQDGKLSHYLAVLLGVVGVLIALPGYRYVAGARIAWEFSGSTDVMMTALLVLAVGATLASIMFRGHLLAALALGVAGYAVGGIFLLEPAPDVAMVQIVVETLGTVLIIVMLSRISERKRRRAADALWGRGRGSLRRDVLISTLVGLGVGAFTLTAVVNRPARNTVVADWYLDNAQAVGVRDVVGAIITDFRATDTLVEITVFAMAALGVLTVLHLRLSDQPPTGTAEPPGGNIAARSLIETPLTRYAATLLFPVAVVIALAHLLYAGDAPGDGFTAGVIGGISVALWYQVFGYGRRRMSKYLAASVIGGGMALAISNGLLQLVLGRPFLAHDAFGDVPLVAGLHFSSATVLEVAIALTVFGSVITMLNAIMTPEGIEQL